jgi:hypothetical protein
MDFCPGAFVGLHWKEEFFQSEYKKEGEAGFCQAASMEFIKQCIMRNSNSMAKAEELCGALAQLVAKVDAVIAAQRKADSALPEVQRRLAARLEEIKDQTKRYGDLDTEKKQLELAGYGRFDQYKVLRNALHTIAELDPIYRGLGLTALGLTSNEQELGRSASALTELPYTSLQTQGLIILMNRVTIELNDLAQAVASRDAELARS